ncbi:hypothetical protein M1N16_07680 [Nitrospinaceae bacterium]|nr:hypothetical protein [Nitrospinaceae bacterium]
MLLAVVGNDFYLQVSDLFIAYINTALDYCVSLLPLLFLGGGEGFGEWNEAALKYAQDRVRRNPKGVDAHTKLGFNLNKLDRYQKAIVILEEAIRIKSDFVLAHNDIRFSYY